MDSGTLVPVLANIPEEFVERSDELTYMLVVPNEPPE
jgi:hypothetical protein